MEVMNNDVKVLDLQRTYRREVGTNMAHIRSSDRRQLNAIKLGSLLQDLFSSKELPFFTFIYILTRTHSCFTLSWQKKTTKDNRKIH